jgi:hypothetical protein
LRLKPRIDVAIEQLSPECRDKIKTVLQSSKKKPTEVSPFADIAFGIRRIYRADGPLRVELTGDQFDKIPWLLTATILESALGWNYRGAEKVVYIRTKKRVRRMKNVGLFYHDDKLIAVMYCRKLGDDHKRILVRWLERKDKIMVEYRPAGPSDGTSRLGYRYFIDFVMFSSLSIKRKAVELLTPAEEEFNKKYEPTLSQTRRMLTHSTNGKGQRLTGLVA